MAYCASFYFIQVHLLPYKSKILHHVKRFTPYCCKTGCNYCVSPSKLSPLSVIDKVIYWIQIWQCSNTSILFFPDLWPLYFYVSWLPYSQFQFFLFALLIYSVSLSGKLRINPILLHVSVALRSYCMHSELYSKDSAGMICFYNIK